MQDKGNDAGDETHIVVDGQQRIRAVLDFITGSYALDGDDITRTWKGKVFDDLSPDERARFFNYKFVVRVLPPELDEEGLRLVFKRLNKNVASLNDQEIRNATYWGPFIRTIQNMADEPIWSDFGVFSAADARRMIDHEYISELAIAHLHGPQNKKDKLDHFYQMYEETFDGQDDLTSVFNVVISEISAVMPRLKSTRWRKKSDFYTLFLEFASRADQFPLAADVRRALGSRLMSFGETVDAILRIEETHWANQDANAVTYARAVSRAASDRGSRTQRAGALSSAVFVEEPSAQTN